MRRGRLKKKRKMPKPVRLPSVVLSLDRRLIVIDQVPLRREAEKNAKAGMKAVAKIRAELEEFEKKILPEFQRWESAAFGAILTEERELNARLDRTEALIERVTMEAFFRGCPHYEAYALVMSADEREQNPAEGDDGDWEFGGGTPPGEDEDDGRTPEERIFHEFLRGALGVEPEFLHRSEYQKLFREFQRMTGAAGGSRPQGGRGVQRVAGPPDKSSRIKELYRILARRLHPDSCDSDAATAGLWHDLQESYTRGDVERMEILLAITDLHEGTGGSRTTLFHMRQVVREFARAVAALKSQLRKAKKSPAWKFWNHPDRASLEKIIRSELEESLGYLRREVADSQAVLDRWEKQSAAGRGRPAPKPPAARRRTSGPSRPSFPGQSFFDF